jgi:hypothetical protein
MRAARRIVAVAALLAFASASAIAEDVPSRAGGLWNVQETVYVTTTGQAAGPGDNKTYRICVHGRDDAVKVNRRRPECRDRTATRASGTYVVSETCVEPNGTMTLKTVYSGNFQTTWQQDTYAVADGADTLMSRVVATRVGACPLGQ